MGDAPVKRPRGRPGIYTQELADEICQRIAEGETLTAICKPDDFPVALYTVLEWVRLDVGPGFSASYARARTTQADVWADELKDVSRNPHVGKTTTTVNDRFGTSTKVVEQDMTEHRRLQISATQWLIARANRNKYGDRAALLMDTEESGVLRVKIENDPDASS